jgi:hypothetical protein
MEGTSAQSNHSFAQHYHHAVSAHYGVFSGNGSYDAWQDYSASPTTMTGDYSFMGSRPEYHDV